MAVDEMVVKWSMDSSNFNEGLNKLNKSMNLLQSEFKATSSKLKNFGTDMDQLKNKQQFLTNSIDIQAKKVEVLKNAYEKAKKETGENSEQTQKAAMKVNNAVAQYNKLEGELKQVTTAINNQNSKIPTLANNLDKLSKKAKAASEKFSNFGNKMTTSFTLPIIAGGAAAVNLASDYDETANKCEAVFGDMSKDIKDWSKSSAVDLGMSSQQFMDSVTLYGSLSQDILKMNSIQSAEFGRTLTQRAADISSYYNLSTDRSNELIKQLFSGETDGWKDLGITINDTTMQEYALEKGIKKAVSKMSLQEKTSLRVKMAMEKTNRAANDFQNTSDGTANSSRQFTASIKDLGIAFGQHILPTLTPIIKSLTDLIQKFSSLDSGTQQSIVKFGLFLAIIGPASKLIGGFCSGIKLTSDAIKWMSTNLTIANIKTKALTVATKLQTIAQKALDLVMKANPTALIITGIILLIGAIMKLWNESEAFRNFITTSWEQIKEAFTNFNNFLTGVFAVDWTESFGAFGNIFNGFFANISNIWEAIKKLFGGIIDFVAGVFTGDWDRAWSGIQDIFGGIWDGLVAMAKWPLNSVIALVNAAIDGINSISVDIPDWVPGFGGSHIGFDLGRIGYLENGGILTKPTFMNGFVAGEKNQGRTGQAEAVIPLATMYNKIDDIISDRIQQAQQPIIVENTTIVTMDGREVSRITERRITNNQNSRNYSRGGVKLT